MLTAANVWHGGEAVVLTYGDSMLFLKCVTDRGGSERTKHARLAFDLRTPQVNQELTRGRTSDDGPLLRVKASNRPYLTGKASKVKRKHTTAT